MYLFYVIAVIPLVVGMFLWFRYHSCNLLEWVGSTALALTLAGILHYFALRSQVEDYQTLSGQVTQVVFNPEFTERYEEDHSETVTDSDGKSYTRHWTTTEYARHRETWFAYTNLNTEHEINPSFFEKIAIEFKDRHSEYRGNSQCTHGGVLVKGDKNRYVSNNTTGYLYPINVWDFFENRIKSSSTLFSFSKPPKDTVLHPYPSNPNPFSSQRLVGLASKHFSIFEFDRLNARVGPTKRANVILLGFPASLGLVHAQYHQAHWVGGKKNDVVLCYGYDDAAKKVTWSYCFGWTDQERVKKELESLILGKEMNNELLPQIEGVINQHYKLVDWHKYDYIQIYPKGGALFGYVILLILTQGAWWYWAMTNEHRCNVKS